MKSYGYDPTMGDSVKYGTEWYVIALEVSLCLPTFTPTPSVRSHALEGNLQAVEEFPRQEYVSFVRASGSEGVVLSARNWTHGTDTALCTDRGPRVSHPSRRVSQRPVKERIPESI